MPPIPQRNAKALPQAQQVDKLAEVEKKLFQLEIADLNKRLANLRIHNEKIEKENEEFHAKSKQKEIDRQDVIA